MRCPRTEVLGDHNHRKIFPKDADWHLPLLDHHRGWTHWRLSPFLVVLLPAYVFAYWRTVQAEAIGAALTTAHVVAATLMAEHGLALVAALVGWYTHLLLDGRFKIFPTGKDHY